MNWKSVIKSIGAFLRSCIDHPKTSAAGVALIAAGVTELVHNPASILTGTPIMAILGGLGLLASADARPKETTQ